MLRDILDSITGPSPVEDLAVQNTEYDGESIEELLPPQSKGGVHMSYSPSREQLRTMLEHNGPESMIGMEYNIRQCGTWQFVERIDAETVREQCDSCGEYRTIEQSGHGGHDGSE